MYFCYVLLCADNTLYTGYTNDIERRVNLHNTSVKGAKYTASRRPLQLLHYWELETRSSAMSQEAKFKKLSRNEKLRLIAKDTVPIIKPATQQDGQTVLKILMNGKQSLLEADVDQWQNDYIKMEMIEQDIGACESYLLFFGDVAVASFVFTDKPDYAYDKSGAYVLSPPYTSLHRVAVLSEFKGLGIGGMIVDYCINRTRDMNMLGFRCDTHEHNKPMRRMLIKNGFEERGPIQLEDGSPRIAYELGVDKQL